MTATYCVFGITSETIMIKSAFIFESMPRPTLSAISLPYVGFSLTLLLWSLQLLNVQRIEKRAIPYMQRDQICYVTDESITSMNI